MAAQQTGYAEGSVSNNSYADFTDRIAIHFGDGPGQAIPFDLIAHYRFAANQLNDELAERLLFIHAFVQIQAINL
ncbi:hypothetical protein D3C72_815880 [compost metagenome]